MKTKIKKNKFIFKALVILFFANNIFAFNSDSISTLQKFKLKLNFNLNSFPQIKESSFDSVIEYKSGGTSIYVDKETAKAWENIPSLMNLEFGFAQNDWLSFDGVVYLRKDIEAWYKDKNSTNIFLSTREFDMNVPFISKLNLKYDELNIRIGRFPFSLNQNSNRSVSISGSPYDDAISVNYSKSNITFDYYFANLNSWLHNQYLRNYSSEYFRQNSFVLYQQRERIYNEQIKTIVAHKINYQYENINIGISELSVIGGKTPTITEINPFSIWHNDYNDGFTNSMFSFEGAVKINQHKIYAEIAFDDLISGMNESGADSKNIYAYLIGSEFVFSNPYQNIILKIEAINVNPYFGNHDIPLLKFISRRIYNSNFRHRSEINYGDTYFVDYPIGYYRGPDVIDFWLDFIFESEKFNFKNEFGWLRNGTITLAHAHKGDDDKMGTDYELILPIKSKNELRNFANLNYKYSYKMNFDFGLLARKIEKTNLYLFLGFNYSFDLIN